MHITIIRMLLAVALALPLTTVTAASLPERGMSKDTVRQQFGRPDEQRAAVGTPPISRWIYKDFTVYFEGDHTIHAVAHARPAPAPVSPPPARATVDELPPIEEIDPDTETAEPAPTEEAPGESQFRFDPATGRIIEIGPDGQPVASPAAQPAPREAPAETAPVEATEPVEPVREAPEPAPQPEPEPEAAPAPAPTEEASDEPSFRFDPTTGRIVPVGEPAQPAAPAETPAPRAAEPEAQPEPTPAPQAEPEPQPEPAQEAQPEPAPQGGFRFDPRTGQMVPNDQPAAQPEPRTAPASPEPSADTPEQPATEEDGGGFSIDW